MTLSNRACNAHNVCMTLGVVSIMVGLIVVYGYYLVSAVDVFKPHPIHSAIQQDAEAEYKHAMSAVMGDSQSAAPDIKKIVQILTKAAEGGLAEAQFTLASIYYQGVADIVTQNYPAAYVWYSLAASAGYEKAYSFRYEVSAHLSPAELVSAKKEIAVFQENIFQKTVLQ